MKKEELVPQPTALNGGKYRSSFDVHQAQLLANEINLSPSPFPRTVRHMDVMMKNLDECDQASRYRRLRGVIKMILERRVSQSDKR